MSFKVGDVLRHKINGHEVIIIGEYEHGGERWLIQDDSWQTPERILAHLYDVSDVFLPLEIRQGLVHAKSIDEWHEDHGNCLWWKFPIMETPYVGSPLDVDFPIDVTHFTKFIEPIAPKG